MREARSFIVRLAEHCPQSITEYISVTVQMRLMPDMKLAGCVTPDEYRIAIETKAIKFVRVNIKIFLLFKKFDTARIKQFVV